MDHHRSAHPERGWGIAVPTFATADCRLGLCLCLVLSQSTGELACAQVSPEPGPKPEQAQSILRRTRERNRQYQAPTLDELLKVEAAGRALLTKAGRGPPGDQQMTTLFVVAMHLQDTNFELVPTKLGGAPAVAVCETPLHHRGGGVYFFRLGAVPRERLVQVPHSFFDLGTLEIGRELAHATLARALFVNTVHRHQGAKFSFAEEEDVGDAPADLAHQAQSFYQSLTLAALATLPQLQVLQVHGFADGAVVEYPQAAVVVSAGAAPAGEAEAARVAGQLATLLGPDRVLLYPRDTHKLGARSNQQGRAVAQVPFATFLHLELSRSLREELLRSAGLLHAFAAAVLTPVEGIR
jgi:hypothetical protein